MWTAIWSRARTTLTVLAVLLTMVLVVAVIFLALQWAEPDQTYTYQSYDLEVTPSAPWRPGQSLSLAWAPSYSGMTVPKPSGFNPPSSAPPSSVTCQFSLYGPYATYAGAPTSGGGPMIDGTTPVASAPPLTLSTNVGTIAPPQTYVLPTDLAPGYYVVVGSADEGDPGGTSSSWVVEVTA